MLPFSRKSVPYFEEFYIVRFDIFRLIEILQLHHGIIQRSFCVDSHRLNLYHHSDMSLLYVGCNAILFQFYAGCIRLHETCEYHYTIELFPAIIMVDQISRNSYCTVFFTMVFSSVKSSFFALTGIFIVEGIEPFRIFLTVSSKF